jgi:hypothetical protein
MAGAVAFGVAVRPAASLRPSSPGSTLVATLRDRDGDGVLAPGPGEPLVDRNDLAPSSPVRRVLLTFAQLSDIHVTDEESPLRAEVVDRLDQRVGSAFRMQESLSLQILAAAELAVAPLHPAFVLLSGDLIDNAQRNELDWFLRAVRGGTIRPDSGAAGYDGLQAAENDDPFIYRPDVDAPRHPGLLDAAQRPFAAPGLTVPWLPLVSNHDVLIQGVVPADRALVRIATGHRKLVSPSPDTLAAVERDGSDAHALDSLLVGERAGRFRDVPSDPARRPYTPAESVRAVAAAAGITPVDDRLLWVNRPVDGITLIGLDTANRAGGADGVLDSSTLAWVAAQLRRVSGDHIIVASPTPLEETVGGEAALQLLDRTPGVLAVLSGDTHRAQVRPRATGGYWLVRAPSLIDFPQQARAYRVVELTDGRVALETWLVDHAGRTGAAGWLGLAGVARDLAFLDPQGGRPRGWGGHRLDRNVRLFIPG